MILQQAIRPMLASTAVLLIAGAACGQTPPPKNPGNSTTVQIIPVSLKNSDVAAVVNGEKILIGEVRQILDQKPYPTTIPEKHREMLRKAALEVLIEDAVTRHYLSKQIPPSQISQEAFNKEYYKLTEGLKKLTPPKTLDAYLAENGQTREMLQRDLIALLQRRVLLQKYYPDDKLKTYYEANKPHFDQTFVRASHILIKVKPDASKEERGQAIAQLRGWRQEILSAGVGAKTKFEEIAKKYSDCPTKDNKDAPPGDIGEFTYKFVVVPEFAKAAFSMKKNELSDVVQTVFGVHLIWVTDRKEGKASQFEDIREAVREVWALDDDLMVRLVADYRKTIEIKIHMP